MARIHAYLRHTFSVQPSSGWAGNGNVRSRAYRTKASLSDS